jgi:hypothetical protein
VNRQANGGMQAWQLCRGGDVTQSAAVPCTQGQHVMAGMTRTAWVVHAFFLLVSLCAAAAAVLQLTMSS